MYARNITCEKNHTTEGLYPNQKAFKKVLKLRQVSCAICGSTNVKAELAAPRINKGSNGYEMLRMLKELKAELERADNVGDDFARTARDMHNGKSPRRAIKGNLTGKQRHELIEEGVEHYPVPEFPRYDA